MYLIIITNHHDSYIVESCVIANDADSADMMCRTLRRADKASLFRVRTFETDDFATALDYVNTQSAAVAAEQAAEQG